MDGDDASRYNGPSCSVWGGNLKQQFQAAVAVTLVFLVLPSFIAAQDNQKGYAAFQIGDFETALENWRPLAERGDASAQYNLGYMYQNGLGVPGNNAEAVRWYRLAADQGDADAQFNLGLMYYNGDGVPKDDVEAVRWFRLAADQGDAAAQNGLGVMYADGNGVPEDDVQAVRWFGLAADQGHAGAQKYIDNPRLLDKETAKTYAQGALAGALVINFVFKRVLAGSSESRLRSGQHS